MTFSTTHHAAYENRLLNRHLDELEEDEEQEETPFVYNCLKTSMLRWSDTGKFWRSSKAHYDIHGKKVTA